MPETKEAVVLKIADDLRKLGIKEDDTILMQEDGTTLTYQDFQVGDPIGVVIEGMIQETSPAIPECVTMIVKLHS